MRIPYRQHWLLRRMDRMLRRSDPHLAAMLVIFARLYCHEEITSVEQARRVRVLAFLIWLGRAVRRVAGGLAAGARRMIRHVAAGCVAVRRRFSGDHRGSVGARAADR